MKSIYVIEVLLYKIFIRLALQVVPGRPSRGSLMLTNERSRAIMQSIQSIKYNEIDTWLEQRSEKLSLGALLH